VIPHHLHLYWEGPRPGWVDDNLAQLRRLHPTWQITEWSPHRNPADRVSQLGARYHTAAGRVAPHHVIAYRSNLVRYAALWTHGGVWVDSDIICHQPLDALAESCEAFLPAGERNPQVCVIGAARRHPFIGRLIQAAVRERPAPHRVCTGVRHVAEAGTHDVALIGQDVIFVPNQSGQTCPDGVVAEHRKG
jgi:mannosyltransferase OCH1-like enzyme